MYACASRLILMPIPATSPMIHGHQHLLSVRALAAGDAARVILALSKGLRMDGSMSARVNQPLSLTSSLMEMPIPLSRESRVRRDLPTEEASFKPLLRFIPAHCE